MMVMATSAVLAGCSSPAERMAQCAAQGISKDTCYLVEQNRQQSYNEAAQNAAYANARDAAAGRGVWAKKDKHHDADQHAQAAKKPKQWEGMKLDVTSHSLTVDGKPAAMTEKTPKATVYQQGLFNFIVYSTGKIAVTDLNNVFKGYAK